MVYTGEWGVNDEYSPPCTRYLPDILFPMMNDDEVPLPGYFVFVRVAEASENRWIRWTRNRMMDPAWLIKLLDPLSLSLPRSFFLFLYLSLREGSYLPQFDPRGVYDLPVQVGFLSPFLTRTSRDISRGADAFIALYRACKPRGAFGRFDNWVWAASW